LRLLVACPTRDRPQLAVRLARSFVETTSVANLVFYVDNDQRGIYFDDISRAGISHDRIKIETGDRIGPVQSAEYLCAKYRAGLFGFVPDDCEFKTPGWDEYAIGLADGLPRRECVISPAHPFGSHVDIPFVTREWLDVVGEFAPSGLVQWCWPTAMALLGEIGDVAVKCDPERFYINHEMKKSEFGEERLPIDAVKFYMWCVHEFPRILTALKAQLAKTK